MHHWGIMYIPYDSAMSMLVQFILSKEWYKVLYIVKCLLYCTAMVTFGWHPCLSLTNLSPISSVSGESVPYRDKDTPVGILTSTASETNILAHLNRLMKERHEHSQSPIDVPHSLNRETHPKVCFLHVALPSKLFQAFLTFPIHFPTFETKT
jgi:hypothetical protein